MTLPLHGSFFHPSEVPQDLPDEVAMRVSLARIL